MALIPFISLSLFIIWAFYEEIRNAIVQEIDPDDDDFM